MQYAGDVTGWQSVSGWQREYGILVDEICNAAGAPVRTRNMGTRGAALAANGGKAFPNRHTLGASR